jgi:chlorobactene glucosyltransferase
MLYQQIIAGVLAFILVNILLNLRSLRKAAFGAELPDEPPMISVLIPARNEEANIGTCLESLRDQDYPNYEILVLDDSSTDQTAQIVARFEAEDHRIRLIHGGPLPEGWAGKPYACHSLSQEARGSWLLFADADTVHARAILRHVLNTALGTGAGLISGFPHQRTTSIWQNMALTVMLYYMILCWMPLWWLQRSERALPSLTIGQFLFFSTDAYRTIGGHESVKSQVLEDVCLGKEISRHGLKQVTLDLSQLVSCQMYREFRPMWDGIIRWLYSVASLSTVMMLVIVIVVTMLFLAPFLWLVHGLLLSETPFSWKMVVGMQVGILLLGRYLVGRRFSQPKSSILLHPFGIGFLVIVSFYASCRSINRAGITWKGRIYR